MNELINRRDMDFLLFEVFDAVGLCRSKRYAHHDRETFTQIIDTAETLAVEKFMPHAAKLDQNEPKFDGERVHLIPEVKEALNAYIEGGFTAVSFDTEDGGLQLPYLIASAALSYFNAANVSTTGYMFLTAAAANMERAHASEDQKRRYMKPMLQGRYFGTMCLSEPQAGSSLADIRTRAIKQPDGTYHIIGNKMWISGGDHELSENIIHHVLARVEGAPAGVKGISLFIVPKYRVNADGTRGARNGVRLAGLNHKMGFHGTTNCALNFGEKEPAVGELIGQENQGLSYMFHMMNEARISVGLGAAMLGYAGYTYSLQYAKTRAQGRPVTDRNPASAPVPIIEHPDVRRMLLLQKVYAEGGVALCMYCARLVDELEITEDEKRREELKLLLEILTPMAKAWPSEYCLEANKLAIQVLGGYGYTRDYPVERLYRDNRLNPIHEGTNGIQALDLLGRKVTMQNGAALRLLLSHINETLESAGKDSELTEYVTSLRNALDAAGRTTLTLTGAMMKGQIPQAMANASYYLDMLGHIVIAWMWLRQAQTARTGLASGAAADRDFYRGKLHACRFFFRYELPKALRNAELLNRLDDTTLTMSAELF
jgi:butyryl-CoA dehydrogenase